MNTNAASEDGEGRPTGFLGDSVTADVLLMLCRLLSSLLVSLEDQTFGTGHRRQVFTTELCPSPQASSYYDFTFTPLVKISFTTDFQLLYDYHHLNFYNQVLNSRVQTG